MTRINVPTEVEKVVARNSRAERVDMAVTSTTTITYRGNPEPAVTGTPEGWDVSITALLANGVTATVGQRVLLQRMGYSYIAYASLP